MQGLFLRLLGLVRLNISGIIIMFSGCNPLKKLKDYIAL